MSFRWEDKPKEEIERYYIEVYERLVRANHLYDQGHLSEAPNIASLAMSIIYDHGTSSISLLEHMKLKSRQDFVDSSLPSVASQVPPGSHWLSNEYLLIEARITFNGQDYKAFLETRNPITYVLFDEWWNGVILSRYIREPPNREYIRRGEILKYIRNEESGAHIAGKYRRGAADDKLARLMQGEYVDGYMHLNDGPAVTAEQHAPAYATLRQIGWEVEEMMRRMRPDLTERANLDPRPGPRLRPAPPDML